MWAVGATVNKPEDRAEASGGKVLEFRRVEEGIDEFITHLAALRDAAQT